MSEPRSEWSDLWDAQLLLADGRTVQFSQLLQTANIVTEERFVQFQADYAALLASQQAQLDAARADMQRQIDQLREDVKGSEPVPTAPVQAPRR